MGGGIRIHLSHFSSEHRPLQFADRRQTECSGEGSEWEEGVISMLDRSVD